MVIHLAAQITKAFIDKLRAENVISGWDSKHNRFERTGNTWSEREVDKLGERAWKRVGMTTLGFPSSGGFRQGAAPIQMRPL